MNTNLQFNDITAPQDVEVRIRHDGKVLWVNIDGICVLRCCRIVHLEVKDERPPQPSERD